jgi:serine/threonine protein kinase
MATGSMPFHFKSWKEHAATLTQFFLDHFPYDTSLPFSLVHLLKKIFTMDKQERISIDELMKHNFFTG